MEHEVNVEINGQYYERVGGMTIPTDLPGLEQIPETRVRIKLEFEGGGMKEGEMITLELEPLKLTKYGQFTFDVLEETPDIYDHLPNDVVPRARHQAVRMQLDFTPVDPNADKIYTVTYPGGQAGQ